MSTARIFTPENRLAKALSSLEGQPISELAASAEVRAARLEGAIRLYVHEKLKLITPFAAYTEERLFAESRDLGAHATHVAEVAGAAGLHAIGEAARGIGAMIANLASRGVWHTDALRLHLDALALLNQRMGASPADNDVVLSRLRNLREAIGVHE